MVQLDCRKQNVYQYVLLTSMMLMGVSIGVWHSIPTPTLPNLKEKLNTSYESIGKMISVGYLGNIVGLLVSGYLYDTFTTYIPYMMFGECLMGGIASIILPWCNQIGFMTIFFFIQSANHGAINNGSHMIILKTFKAKSMGKMQIYHLGYGIGALLSGFIARPFLSNRVSEKARVTKYCFSQFQSRNESILNPIEVYTNDTASTPMNRGSFEYIYLIAGLMAISSALIFLIIIRIKNPMKSADEISKKESWLKKIHPNYIANGSTWLGVSMIVLLFLYYFLYVFIVLHVPPFIVVYAMDPCKSYTMDQKTAAYLHSAINGCFTIGRIMFSLIIDLKPTLLLLLFNICTVLSILILLVFGDKYVVALWVGAGLLRFCNSIAFPSGSSYANRYIIVTSSLISIGFLGATAGGAAGQSTGAYIIDNYPSSFIFYTSLVSASLLLVNVIIMIILGRKVGKRDFSKEKVASKNEDEKLLE